MLKFLKPNTIKVVLTLKQQRIKENFGRKFKLSLTFSFLFLYTKVYLPNLINHLSHSLFLFFCFYFLKPLFCKEFIKKFGEDFQKT